MYPLLWLRRDCTTANVVEHRSFDWFVTNQPQIRLESVQMREWFPAYVGQYWFIPWLLLRVFSSHILNQQTHNIMR